MSVFAIIMMITLNDTMRRTVVIGEEAIEQPGDAMTNINECITLTYFTR